MILERRRAIGLLTVAAVLSAASLRAQDDSAHFHLTLGAAAAKAVPSDYLGFSYESTELADPAFFAADNSELVSLFKTLAPEGILRLGGNSSEFCWWKAKEADRPPELPASARRADNWMPHSFTAIEPPAIDHLAEFLQATGWNAIYGLNLGTGTPEGDAEEAAYVAGKLGPRLLYFQIGNEPEYYRNASNRLRAADWNFDQYLAQWLIFARAVQARVPGAKFGGPDVGSDGQWVIQFARQAPPLLPGAIVACSGHYYVMGPPDNPLVTVQRLLAPTPALDRDLPRVIGAAAQTGLAYRMTEGNSCYRGGKPGVSNAFCSALWAADYLLKLASFGCAGVNLHSGGASVIRLALGGHLPGENLAPDGPAIAAEGSFYTPIAGSRGMGFKARPIFYGMKLAGLLSGGKMRPAAFDQAPANASAWAAEMPDGRTRLIVINKDSRQKLRISILSAREAESWRLRAPGLAATSGVTLAGAGIQPGPSWQPLPAERVASGKGEVQFEVEPASAVAIFFDGAI
jgi:hypothetical protein